MNLPEGSQVPALQQYLPVVCKIPAEEITIQYRTRKSIMSSWKKLFSKMNLHQ
jgi:hypothetical protein